MVVLKTILLTEQLRYGDKSSFCEFYRIVKTNFISVGFGFIKFGPKI